MYAGRNIVPGLGQAKQYGDANPVNIIPLDNGISNDNTDMNKQYKTYTYSLSLKMTTHYHANIYMGSTIAGQEDIIC